MTADGPKVTDSEMKYENEGKKCIQLEPDEEREKGASGLNKLERERIVILYYTQIYVLDAGVYQFYQ